MKKVIYLFVFLQFVLVGVPSVFSASDKCVVKKSSDNIIVLECSKKGENFKVNDKVKIKSIRTKAVEGC